MVCWICFHLFFSRLLSSWYHLLWTTEVPTSVRKTLTLRSPFVSFFVHYSDRGCYKWNDMFLEDEVAGAQPGYVFDWKVVQGDDGRRKEPYPVFSRICSSFRVLGFCGAAEDLLCISVAIFVTITLSITFTIVIVKIFFLLLVFMFRTAIMHVERIPPSIPSWLSPPSSDFWSLGAMLTTP